MQLLLMPQEQIAASKAPGALWTLEWFFFGVGSLVALQVLQTGKGALASAADVGSRFVSLGRWEGCGGFRVDHDSRSCKTGEMSC